MEAIYFESDDELLQKQEINTSRGTLIAASIADLHFPVKNIGPEMQYKILEEQFIAKIVNLPKLDIIFVLGDLYDHKVLTTSDAALYASMFIGKLVELCRVRNITLIILQGTLTHDSNQLKLYYHYMYDNTVDVRIVTKIQIELVKGARILCIPELYGIDESEYQKFFTYSGFYDLAVLHGTMEGSVYGNNTTGNSRLFHIEDFMNCRGPILGGHVHKPGTYGDSFYYCGSPYAWSFADDHNKGFILLAYNLDTRKYYLDYEWIKSFKYETITISEIINNDPQVTIAHIDKLKQEQGIDFLRVIFDTDVQKVPRMIISNNYQGNQNITLQFPNTQEEIKQIQKQQEENERLSKYEFLTNPQYSDEEKFCMYVNMLKGQDNFITVDGLRKILEEDI